VRSGLGDDTVEGGAMGDDLSSDGGNNSVHGNGGADKIKTRDGDDTLNGGAGADTLTGGDGNDVFEYDALADSFGAASHDLISDFTSGIDMLDLGTLAGATPIGFVGNAADTAGTLAKISTGSGFIETVFQQDTNTLWADVNDDGVLDDNDLQITLNGVAGLVAADITGAVDQSAIGTGDLYLITPGLIIDLPIVVTEMF
jgi:Ca2+-binding RTX toxin-like protein